MASNPESDQGAEKRIADEAARWVVRMHSGEASTADEKELAAWRARDARHEVAYRDAERDWAAASDLHQDPLTGLARTGKRSKSRKPRKAFVFLAGAGLAASLLAWSFSGGPHDYGTRTAEVRVIVLPDGSRATMNARSAMDVHFTPDSRQVTVANGEVFFQVAADARRPFQVSAQDARITALGTAFNVKSRAAEKQVEVSVLEHAVAVAVDGKNAASNSVRVRDGQQVVVRRGDIGAIEPADGKTVLAWRDGLLIAESKPLAEVVDELRAYHPGWIIIAGAAAERIRVSAVLKLNEPIASLDALSAGLPITVRHVSPYLTLVVGY